MKTKLVIFIVAMLLCGTVQTVAQQKVDAKYCMTYDDFQDNRWVPVGSLVEGHTKQFCQMKFEDDQFKFRTGDKEADGILKKAAFAVMYSGHLYVNCRNLRVKDVPLDVSNYAQAYRYDGNKLCVVAHWINGGAVLAGIAGDVATIVAPLPVALPSAVGSEVIWWNMDKQNSYRCYLLDSEANAKGKTAVTRIDDEFMEKLLVDDDELLDRYKAVDKKRDRQSASNILPVLQEKGLISE